MMPTEELLMILSEKLNMLVRFAASGKIVLDTSPGNNQRMNIEIQADELRRILERADQCNAMEQRLLRIVTLCDNNATCVHIRRVANMELEQ
jgi:hypothetical protein